ncbi:MAG: TolC family protein [Thermoguttaceae bacterium]
MPPTTTDLAAAGETASTPAGIPTVASAGETPPTAMFAPYTSPAPTEFAAARPAGETPPTAMFASYMSPTPAEFPGVRPVGAPVGETPPTAMFALYTSPTPAETPSAKPVADDSSQLKPPGSPDNAIKPKPLLAAAQPSAAMEPISVPKLAVPASGARAEQAIADVLQYTTQHHPLLRVRQYEIEAARAKIVTARLLPNPELTVDTLDSSAEPGPPELNTRLMFTLPIGPKRELRTAAAETGVCQAQLAMSRDTKLILAEAADAAVEVLYLQELYSLYGQLGGLANQVVGIQTDRFNVAAVPYRNVVLTELSASKLELLRQNTAAQLDQAKVRLARAVGATDGTPPNVEGNLAVEPIAFAPVNAMQARVRQVAPEMAESRTAIEKSREELSLEQWNAVPDLKIGPRYRADLSGATDDRWGGRVQLDLPFFDRNQGHIAEGAAILRTNCAKRDLIEVTTISDATSLYLELQDVQTRAAYYSTQIRPLLAKTEKALREAFVDREVSAYELTDLLEAMARMQLSDLDLRHEHQRLRMRLELLLECRLPAASAAIPPSAPAAAIPPVAPAPIPPPPSKPLPALP